MTCSVLAAAIIGLMMVPIAFVGFEPQVDIRSADSLVQISNPESRASGNPPVFLATPSDPTFGDSGAPIGFQVVVRDSDNDTLNVTWDWGDGLIDTNLTLPAASLQIVRQYHTYNPASLPGVDTENFTLNISLDDGNGNIAWDLTTVIVTRPPNGSPMIIGMMMSPSGSKIRVNPGDELTIISDASDPEGEPLTWTYKFSDSASEYDFVDHTAGTAPGAIVWSNITHSFSAVGIYTVLLNLSDAVPPYDVWPHNVSEHLELEVVANVAPQSSSLIFVDPSNPIVRSEMGYELVNYTIEAADDDGDILTATWDFDDGSPLVNQTSPGGTNTIYGFIVQRNYTDAGFFNVSVTVTDGIPGHEISLSVFVQVNSTNRPPSLFSVEFDLSMGSYAQKNESIDFTLAFTDPEGDPIEVIVDFGDNSSRLYFNLTDLVENNVTLSFNHSYANIGNYTIQIWYTDNKTGLFNHHRMSNFTIGILDHSPVALFTVDPLTGDSSTDFVFDASSSFDIETPTDDLMVRWDFDNDGTWDTDWSTSKLMNHTFDASGNYIVVLEVMDSSGSTNTTTLDVVVTEAIPEFDGLATPILLLAFVLFLFIRRVPPRTR